MHVQVCGANSLAAKLAVKRSGVTGEMNLRNHPNKGSILAFETQGRRHQKSKIEVSVASQKRPMPSKNVLRKVIQVLEGTDWFKNYC